MFCLTERIIFLPNVKPLTAIRKFNRGLFHSTGSAHESFNSLEGINCLISLDDIPIFYPNDPPLKILGTNQSGVGFASASGFTELTASPAGFSSGEDCGLES